jgi:restriction endonuclease S subunit
MTYNYITKPATITANQVKENSFSFSSADYITIPSSVKFIPLRDLLEFSYINSNIDSTFYIPKTNNYLITNTCISDSLTLNFSKLTTVTKKGFETKSKVKAKINDILIANNGSVGQVAIINEERDFITNSNITLLRFLNLKVAYYCIGLFYNSWFRQQCSFISSKSSTQEFITRDALENLSIPFPTTANHANPQLVQDYISLLVQNIIDKEEQISAKNKKIDQLIETELNGNQKNVEFMYKMPTRSELALEERFDAGFYTGEGAKMEQKIIQYQNGFYKIDKKNIRTGNTPKDYIYETEYKTGLYSWVTPKNINGRTLSEITYLRTAKKSPISKFSLVLTGIRYVGNGIFYDGKSPMYCNQNTLIVKQFSELKDQVFLLCFLTSNIGRALQMRRRITGIVPILYLDDLAKIPIPSFPQPKQQEIAVEYYNQVEQTPRQPAVTTSQEGNFRFDLSTYLESNKKRNSQLGIFQLKMELFDLREELEKLVWDVVMGNEINMDI